MRQLLIVIGWVAILASGAEARGVNADTTPPLVTTVIPAAAARNVALNATLQIAFSEPLDPLSVNTVTVQLRDTRNVLVDGAVAYDAQSMVATFVPAAPLLPTRTYTATIAGGTSGTCIRDAAGNALEATYAWTFITTVERTRIAAGATHSVAVDNSGQVWTWGGGVQQRGQTLDARIPGVVGGASGVVSVAAGASHTLALKADGTLLAWGANSEGQLGINNQMAQSAPVSVSKLTNVIAIAAGTASSVALKADGTVWTWGSAHQIGDGQNTRRLTPVQVPGLSDAIAVAAGDVADYALKADGTVWAWGDNTNGQVGDGTGGSGLARLIPVQAVSLTGVVGIAGGSQHALALIGSNLSVRAWGLNSAGQIGDGTTNTQRYTPTLVNGVVDVRTVDGAGNRSLTALLDGSVRVWGSAVTSGGANSATPVGAPGNPQGFQVTGNINHNMSVTTSGAVWTWGLNGSSQLGDGTAIDRRTADTVSGDSYAWKVGMPTFSVFSGAYSQIQTVAVTTATSGAVLHYTLDGAEPTENDPSLPTNGVVVVDRTLTLKAIGWKPGSPASSTGTASYTMQVAQPTFSPAGGPFTSPTTVTVATTSPGTVIHYTIDGSTPSAASPAYSGPIDVATTLTLKAIAMRAGWSDSALRSAAFTMNFGTLSAPTLTPAPGSYEGQVVVTLAAQELSTIRYTTNGGSPTATSTVYGGPLTVNATTTIRAKAFRADYITSAEISGTFAIAAVAPVISRASGTYAPGTNFTITDTDPATTIRVTFNGLDPTSSDSAVPSGTTLLVGSFPVKARAFKAGSNSSAVASASFALTEPFSGGMVSAGGTHTLLATPGGLVYAWGLGTSGQLGLGANSSRTTPTVLSTLTGVVSISGGSVHTLAATWDGRLFAWGSNSSGRLGDGSTTSSPLPLEITSLEHVVAVAAGGSHSLALTADGRVYAWGAGTSGQLGLGSTLSELTPTLIPTLSDVVAIAAGGSHSLAVTSDGHLYAWGLNTSSQLGDGGQTTQTTPKLISALSGVTAVSAGAAHSLARLDDATVFAWGNNTSGQLGLGDTVVRRVPTRIPGLTAVDALAGGSHSMAVTTDGVLVAWGANGSGQVGDTTTTTPRPNAVIVAGFTQAAAIAAGSSHSVAVTSNGHVWTWGSDGFGQLGDGVTASNRPTPLDVLTTPDIWGAAPSPILSGVPGTYNSPQSIIVSNVLGTAAEMHYTTSGAIPSLMDPLVVDGASVLVDRSVVLKLRAWAAGRLPSAVVSASYVLQPAVPSIAPGPATYDSAQNVTMTSSTAGAVVRYTMDGTDPTSSSTLSDGAISINTFTILKAKAFRDGWTPSSTATTTFSFNYGTLPPPTILPAGGRYAPGQTVTIVVGADQQGRYTLDGTDPDQTSAPYVSPIELAAGSTVLKARAFKVDWNASQAVSESYAVTDDVTPPTITASFSPLPNAAGWYDRDVTVTFTCSDAESSVTACASPIVVHTEGPDIPVTGGATDEWGNHASLTVTVNIDRTAPTLNIYTSFIGGTVRAGTEFVTLRGGAYDVSAVEDVSCNGVAGIVTGSLFSCTVSVTGGLNAITVQARDVVGHVASHAVSVFVGNEPDVASISVSPATMTMFAGDSRELFLKDNWGRPVTGEWSVDNSYIAQVTQQDGATILTAIGAGQAVLTVRAGGLTAGATVTVLAAGSEIPSGTTLWSLSDGSSFGAPKRGEVLRAASIDASGDPRTDPALFFVDEGTEWTDGVLERWWNRPTRIRATTADGRELWDLGWTDRRVQQVAADNNGGLVVVLAAQGFEPQIVRRIDGRNGGVTWEFIAAEGGWTTHVSDVVIHPNGTVFFVQTADRAAHLVGIDSTGIASRWLLPGGHFNQIDAGECALDVDKENPAHATFPIVREDGAVVMVANAQTTSARIRTYHQASQCTYDSTEVQRTVSQTYYLLEFVPGAGLTASHIDANGVWATSEDNNLEPNHLLPDGHGGLLLVSIPRVGWVKPSVVSRVDANKQVQYSKEIYNPSAADQHYETEYVLGEDGVYELINSVMPNRPAGTPKYYSTAVQFDSETGTVFSSAQLGAPTTEPEHTRLRFALAGGGIYANGPASAYAVNASVSAAGFAGGGNASPIAGAIWVGFSVTPTVAAGDQVPFANTVWFAPRGMLLQNDNVSSNPSLGIFAKGHTVAGLGHHASLRLVPTNNDFWHGLYPNIFATRDAFGHYFASLGAGPPPPNDTTLVCGALPLVSAPNRVGDLGEPATSLERLRYRPSDENDLILRLLLLDSYYRDELRYCWNPLQYPDTYNSNSYAAGLIQAASIPLPLFPRMPFGSYIGWNKPVPASEFKQQ